MGNDLKTQEQSAQPEGTQAKTAQPITLTTEVQTQESRRKKRHPFLRLARIIRKHRREGPNWTDVAIVMLTCGIVFLAYMQHRDMTDAGTQTDKIIATDERLAKAMEDSVTQAKRGLDASIDISRNDQRAWVGITGIFIRTFVAGQKSDFNIPLQNSGKTAAVEGRTRSFVHVSDAPIDVAAFVATRRDPFQSRMTIFPNIADVNITLVSPLPWSDADVTAIKNGRKFLYVLGEIKYKDVFDRSHRTFFCGMYAMDTPNNMRFCEQYNGAD